MDNIEEDNVKLYIAAALGDEAHNFFESELGQRVIAKSLNAVAEQHRRFEDAKHDDIGLMQDVHFNVLVARKALEWLNEILNEGDHSAQILMQDADA